jgi:hypothetical protein
VLCQGLADVEQLVDVAEVAAHAKKQLIRVCLRVGDGEVVHGRPARNKASV